MPFDRFLTEQLAGDLLTPETADDEARLLTATGYLLLGAINYEEQDKRHLEMDVVDEQLDTLGRGLLGMTLGCARCHDHKFDPIPTNDYYALAGILRSTKTLVHSNVSSWTERELPMPPDLAEAVATHNAAAAKLDERLKAAKKRLSQLAPDPGAVTSRPTDAFPGLVVDDREAVRVGEWTESVFTKPYISKGYLHDADSGKGDRTLTFQPKLSEAGRYEVRLAYTTGSNRASNVPVAILSLDGDSSHTVDMRKPPPIDEHFVSLGEFSFDTSGQWFVMVSNADTDGHVIVDAVQFLPITDAPDVTAPVADAVPDPAVDELKAEVKALEAEKKALAAERPVIPQVMAADEATPAPAPIGVECPAVEYVDGVPVIPEGAPAECVYIQTVGVEDPCAPDATGAVPVMCQSGLPVPPIDPPVGGGACWITADGSTNCPRAGGEITPTFGRHFAILAVSLDDVRYEVIAGQMYFGSDGSFSATIGCNQLGGSVTT
ncbi:DUF1549 domain-containing protein, partial [bacterium]|nr:DUF1549 domain-containing protein [bacterium]